MLVWGPSQGVVLSDVWGRAATSTGALSLSLAGLATWDRVRRGAMQPGLLLSPVANFVAAKLFTVACGESFTPLLVAGEITLEDIPATGDQNYETTHDFPDKKQR